ncbi:MAG TPA: DinB family protein [Dongiaceae bacterium]|nr:DinB family protein [Dongiaceae bacterium]
MQPAASIQAPISLLEKTPAILEILLRDLPNDLLERKPAADRWSILEVLAHMNVIEALYKQRAKLIMLEHSPTLPKFIPHSETDVRHKTAARQLEEFLTLRRAFVVYLHSIPNAAGSRTGEHYEMGTITLSHMLHELANHDLSHLRQVAELYRAYAFYPHAGPFQRYSNPKP